MVFCSECISKPSSKCPKNGNNLEFFSLQFDLIFPNDLSKITNAALKGSRFFDCPANAQVYISYHLI